MQRVFIGEPTYGGKMGVEFALTSGVELDATKYSNSHSKHHTDQRPDSLQQ